MALEPKQVIKPRVVVGLAPATPEVAGVTVAPELERIVEEAPQAPAQVSWRFVKQHTPGQVLRFKDGSEFKFRLIKSNDGSGFCPSSNVDTTDEKLAENLRSLSSGYGVVEIKRK